MISIANGFARKDARQLRRSVTHDQGSSEIPKDQHVRSGWRDFGSRRLVETKMHGFKLLGQRAMARTFDRQITELKVRAAILNRFSQIGTPNTVRAA